MRGTVIFAEISVARRVFSGRAPVARKLLWRVQNQQKQTVLHKIYANKYSLSW